MSLSDAIVLSKVKQCFHTCLLNQAAPWPPIVPQMLLIFLLTWWGEPIFLYFGQERTIQVIKMFCKKHKDPRSHQWRVRGF